MLVRHPHKVHPTLGLGLLQAVLVLPRYLHAVFVASGAFWEVSWLHARLRGCRQDLFNSLNLDSAYHERTGRFHAFG